MCAPRPTTWEVRLERPTGELIQVLGRIPHNQTATVVGVAPAGRFLPVLRGVQPLPEGARPFVVRGPLMEGLASAEVARLRAQEQPPVFPPVGEERRTRIGVYMGGLGAETVLDALKRPAQLRVAAVHRLRAEHLAEVNVLLLPQLADLAELDAAAQARLRKWVESGGRLVLTHDAIGARWHPRLFPQVVQNVELVPATPLVTETGQLPLFPGFRLVHSGGDQFRITLGPAARVVAREATVSGERPGAPVIVTGKVGQGSVVLVGFLSGYLQTELTREETILLAALALGDGK
jgi:hypothetical protein